MLVVRRVLFLAILHLLVTGACFLVGLDFSPVDGDAPSGVARLSAGLAETLMQPGLLLGTLLDARGLPDAVEGALFFANSILWGSMLALILHLVRRRPAAR